MSKDNVVLDILSELKSVNPETANNVPITQGNDSSQMGARPQMGTARPPPQMGAGPPPQMGVARPPPQMGTGGPPPPPQINSEKLNHQVNDTPKSILKTPNTDSSNEDSGMSIQKILLLLKDSIIFIILFIILNLSETTSLIEKYIPTKIHSDRNILIIQALIGGVVVYGINKLL